MTVCYKKIINGLQILLPAKFMKICQEKQFFKQVCLQRNKMFHSANFIEKIMK
jgi:hypothetical protein